MVTTPGDAREHHAHAIFQASLKSTLSIRVAYKRIPCDSTDILIYIICRYHVTSSHMLQVCILTSTDLPQYANSEHYKQKRCLSVHRPEHSLSPERECVCVCMCICVCVCVCVLMLGNNCLTTAN